MLTLCHLRGPPSPLKLSLGQPPHDGCRMLSWHHVQRPDLNVVSTSLQNQAGKTHLLKQTQGSSVGPPFGFSSYAKAWDVCRSSASCAAGLFFLTEIQRRGVQDVIQGSFSDCPKRENEWFLKRRIGEGATIGYGHRLAMLSYRSDLVSRKPALSGVSTHPHGFHRQVFWTIFLEHFASLPPCPLDRSTTSPHILD